GAMIVWAGSGGARGDPEGKCSADSLNMAMPLSPVVREVGRGGRGAGRIVVAVASRPAAVKALLGCGCGRRSWGGRAAGAGGEVDMQSRGRAKKRAGVTECNSRPSRCRRQDLNLHSQ